jgi:hypothetical protein
MTWTKEYQGEFEDIKRELVSDNNMTYPDWNKKFILATNASKQGLGAIPDHRWEREANSLCIQRL